MSSYVDATSSATEHCEAMATLHADLADEYQEIAALTSRKLWHQLTLKVLAFLENPDKLRTTADGTNSFLTLYDKVILAVDKKFHPFNPLSLARMASAVANSLLPQDSTAAKAVLENLLEAKARRNESEGDSMDNAKAKALLEPAKLYLQSKLGLLTLMLLEVSGQPPPPDALAQIDAQLRNNLELLQELHFSQDSAIVHSAHYQCSMTYRKAVGPPEAFYKDAISYLNYTPPNALPEQPHSLAVDIAVAALTGDQVFHFGQVLATPLLAVLQNTSDAWLLELLHAAANGDVLQFRTLWQTYQTTHIPTQPALLHRAQAVQEKITLLALVHMVFERPSSERTLKFDDIAARLHVSLDEVELVIMRALSLGLLEGSMDQVRGDVQVTWVLPRVLDTPQLQALADRMGEWAVKVSKTREYMGEQTPIMS